MNLPSNKVGVLLIAVVLVVVGSISFSIIDKNKKGYENEEAQINNVLTLGRDIEYSDVDTDGDGLLDWEEALRATDPNNRDTDNDGTSDGDEVAQNRNPNIPGPNDTNAEILQRQLEDTQFYDGYVPGSLTDTIGNGLVSTYYELSQSGFYNDEVEQELFGELISKAESESKITGDLNVSQLTTFSFNKEDVRIYGNQFAKIQDDYLVRLAVTDDNDPEIYLSKISKVYDDFSKALMSLAVPSSLANIHTQIANNIQIAGKSIQSINQHSETDPVRSVFAIEAYDKVSLSQVDLYKTIATYFSQNGIIFGSNEVGNFWNEVLSE